MLWDNEVTGFGPRVRPGGRKTWTVHRRSAGAVRRRTLGSLEAVTAGDARCMARALIADVPAEAAVAAPMLRAFGTRRIDAITTRGIRSWFADLAVTRAAPALGAAPALAVGYGRVTELHHGLRATPFMANRVADTLSRIYNAAEERGRFSERSNPCGLVVKFRERARERFLTDGEFRRLGRVLDEAERRKGVSVHAVAAIRLLLLTGCGKGEILNLRWSEVDLEADELRLADSKTGPRTISLSPEAARVLAAVPRDRL